MRELIHIDGSIQPLSGAQVSVEDRGNLFADGIYEVVAFHGGQPLLLEEHLDRWETSAKGLLLDSPVTRAERRARILELVEQSGFQDALVYGQMTRGAGRRNHVFPPAGTPPTEFWFVRALPQYPEELRQNGVGLATHPDERWANCHLKTICLLPNVLAKERARRIGAFESLLIDPADGRVTECTSSNAYAVIDGAIQTHPLGRKILPGITRLLVQRVAQELGIAFIERPVPIGEFRGADEAFITSTTMGVMPATQLDRRPIGSGRVGRITRELAAAVEDHVATVRRGDLTPASV